MTASGEGPAPPTEKLAAVDLFSAADACLTQCDPETKTRWTAETAAAWRGGTLPLGSRERPAFETAPGRPNEPALVPPLKVPKRKLGTERGHAAFVHAIAHIEFNAINLAWDCVQRFRDLPYRFYDDWVSVADDEARHFSMLADRLSELGFAYGNFEAHDGLWEMAEKTRHDAVARMAMVPRFLEARGLDVAPSMIARLERMGDEKTAAIVRIILREEVAHVAAGSRWFRHLCLERGDDPDRVFSELIDRYLVGTVKGPLNLEHRRQAGFTDRELEDLAARKPERN
jgi:uncharacterized ferritin-like protein (DUF455 family)